VLERLVASAPLTSHHGLRRETVARFDTAQGKTAWGLRHLRRFALVDGDEVLASAERHTLTGTLDQQAVRICGIGAVLSHGHDDATGHAGILVERLLERAAQDGVDLALLYRTPDTTSPVPDGFEIVPTIEVELTVAESSRRGAPMTLVRGGEDRDLPAIVAMGQIRARPFRFHLERDVDHVKHAITRRRLLAGLGMPGARQLEFVIAEEGITAAAYAVISVAGGTWTIEECGDRDTSGARVGALLQALIAREPVESRPVISGWLPPGFLPPQVTVASSSPATALLFARSLSARVARLELCTPDVLFWRSDLP
jgi:hypothetical protein